MQLKLLIDDNFKTIKKGGNSTLEIDQETTATRDKIFECQSKTALQHNRDASHVHSNALTTA